MFKDPLFRRGIVGTGLIGLVATILGAISGTDWATFLGLGLTSASLSLALVLAAIQGKDLAALTDKVHQVLFNDVTLRVFYNIQENDKLSERMHKGNIDVKNSLGSAFREMALNAGETDFFGEFVVKRNIFVESGSTYAYLSLEINKYLNDNWHPHWPRHTIFTNNILVFMVLVFQSKCWARLYPGTPAGQYGATYGRGYSVDSSEASGRPQFQGVLQEEMKHFLLGAAQQSIAEKSQDSSHRTHDQYEVDIVLLAASKVHLTYGPHVGSRENVCFKKALLQYCRADGNNVPVFLCIDASKIETEQEDVGDQCRMLYPLEQGSPHFDNKMNTGERLKNVNDVGAKKDDTGFEEFAADIASGRLFLFVGYNDKLRKEKNALEERLTALNACFRRDSKPVVTWRIAESEKIDMLIVYPAEVQHMQGLAREIQLAISTRACFVGEKKNEVGGRN